MGRLSQHTVAAGLDTMTLLKIALFFLISTKAISAAPREIRSYNHCGASWLKLKCSDCSSSDQQCTEWTLQQCKQCNLGPKAALNNHNAGHAAHVGNHHNGANHNLNKGNNIIEDNNNNEGFLNPNAGNIKMGGNNKSGNNNTGDNNGSTNSGNTNSGNTNSGNGSNNKGDNNKTPSKTVIIQT